MLERPVPRSWSERRDRLVRPRLSRIGPALVAVLSVVGGVRPGPAMASPTPLAPLPIGTTVDGIDVSHWQGTIDWSQVAGSGYRFAILKATEGQTFDDPNYAGYRTAANGA